MGRPSLMVNWMLESVDGTPQPDGEWDPITIMTGLHIMMVNGM